MMNFIQEITIFTPTLKAERTLFLFIRFFLMGSTNWTLKSKLFEFQFFIYKSYRSNINHFRSTFILCKLLNWILEFFSIAMIDNFEGSKSIERSITSKVYSICEK